MKIINVYDERKLRLLIESGSVFNQDFGDDEDDVIEFQLYDLSDNLIKIVDNIEKTTWNKIIDPMMTLEEEPGDIDSNA